MNSGTIEKMNFHVVLLKKSLNNVMLAYCATQHQGHSKCFGKANRRKCKVPNLWSKAQQHGYTALHMIVVLPVYVLDLNTFNFAGNTFCCMKEVKLFIM